MNTFVAVLSLVFSNYNLINGQMQPHWGDIQCDMSLSGRYPAGAKYDDWFRHYTFTPSYSTLLPRNVKISTCIEDIEGKTGPTIYPLLWVSPTKVSVLYEYDDRVYSDDDLDCDDGELGGIEIWYNLSPNYVYEIAIEPRLTAGGRYKLTVECEEPLVPTPGQITKSSNITTEFPYYQEWEAGGSMKISCDANAAGMTNYTASSLGDIYEFEITQYAQQLAFTTCDPETAFNNVDDTQTWYNSDITLGRLSYYRINVWYGEGTDIQINDWNQETSAWTTYASGCTTVKYGDAYDDPKDNTFLLAPGKYYVQIQSLTQSYDGYYVLSMMCWNNDAITEAVAGIDYQQATPSPTGSPITPFPTDAITTTDRPTVSNKSLTDFPTVQPTTIPTEVYVGPDPYDSERKSIYKSTISCNLYVHDYLEKKRLNWYKFVVIEDVNYFSFDTCKDDLTDFTACVTLYSLDEDNGIWESYPTYRLYRNSNPDCRYCNILKPGPEQNFINTLPAGTYAIAIYGLRFDKNVDEDYGEYILRMTCPLPEDQGKVVPVEWETAKPTPSPTGILDIPAKDGTDVGEISCGLVITGETKAGQNGKLHKFTVKNGGLDWIKISTCDDTEFYNYLFVYDYYNQTGHESYSFERRDNSLGFHYEDSTTCNEIMVNDLVNGIYYVKIEGYNYFFDHGQYTLAMTCSDNNAVAGARKGTYTEYVPPLEWWAILLIVLACLLCCGICIFAGCWYKKKQGGGGREEVGIAASSPGAEMTNAESGRAVNDGEDFLE